MNIICTVILVVVIIAAGLGLMSAIVDICTLNRKIESEQNEKCKNHIEGTMEEHFNSENFRLIDPFKSDGKPSSLTRFIPPLIGRTTEQRLETFAKMAIADYVNYRYNNGESECTWKDVKILNNEKKDSTTIIEALVGDDYARYKIEIVKDDEGYYMANLHSMVLNDSINLSEYPEYGDMLKSVTMTENYTEEPEENKEDIPVIKNASNEYQKYYLDKLADENMFNTSAYIMLENESDLPRCPAEGTIAYMIDEDKYALFSHGDWYELKYELEYGDHGKNVSEETANIYTRFSPEFYEGKILRVTKAGFTKFNETVEIYDYYYNASDVHVSLANIVTTPSELPTYPLSSTIFFVRDDKEFVIFRNGCWYKILDVINKSRSAFRLTMNDW